MRPMARGRSGRSGRAAAGTASLSLSVVTKRSAGFALRRVRGPEGDSSDPKAARTARKITWSSGAAVTDRDSVCPPRRERGRGERWFYLVPVPYRLEFRVSAGYFIPRVSRMLN